MVTLLIQADARLPKSSRLRKSSLSRSQLIPSLEWVSVKRKKVVDSKANQPYLTEENAFPFSTFRYQKQNVKKGGQPNRFIDIL